MARISKQIIEDAKKRRKKGETIKSIAEDYGVPPTTISYHLNEDYRRYKRDYERNRAKKKLTDEQRKDRSAYSKVYFKNRYKNDPEFRKKHIERVLRRQRELYKKKK